MATGGWNRLAFQLPPAGIASHFTLRVASIEMVRMIWPRKRIKEAWTIVSYQAYNIIKNNNEKKFKRLRWPKNHYFGYIQTDVQILIQQKLSSLSNRIRWMREGFQE